MLQIQGAEPATFGLLKDLMVHEPLNQFHLCGGTALALQFGHRLSVDIDMFSPNQLSKIALNEYLQSAFPDFREVFSPAKSFYFCYIQNIKVDLVYSSAKVISEFEIMDGIRFWGLRDIVAMKLNAIYGRGSKKDFWDLDEILSRYSMDEIVGWFFQKFPTAFEEGLFMSLVYFDDAENAVDPGCLKGKNWQHIKKRIEREVRNYF